MPDLRIFISYTLRGRDLRQRLLKKLKTKFNALNLTDTYIDILDNKNTEDPQSYVIEKLFASDIVILIKSNRVTSSSWVKKELELAAELGKPIMQLTLKSAKKFVKPSVFSSFRDKFRLIFRLLSVKLLVFAELILLSFIMSVCNFFALPLSSAIKKIIASKRSEAIKNFVYKTIPLMSTD